MVCSVGSTVQKMSSNDTNPIFATSIRILTAQRVSSIVWVILCAIGLFMGSLQIITTLLWKPLRKMEQSLILAIAIGDVVKAIGYGIVATKRLYLTAINSNEVSSQRTCVIWLLGIPAPTHFVSVLLVMVSTDRVLALVVPVWYKNRKLAFKVFLIGISAFAGIASGCCSFIGSSADIIQPVCAYGTSPTERYRTYATWFENSMALLTLSLNLISCLAVIIRWRMAIKSKKDMKAFKKNIQLNALKTLLAVVALFLISSAMGTLWLTFINVLNWDDVMRMSYTPLGGCFGLIRGVFDFPLYLLMVREYRRGFTAIFLRGKCGSQIAAGSSVAPMNSRQVQKNRSTVATGHH